MEKKHTFESLVTQWMKEKEPFIKESSRELYEKHVSRHIIPCFRDFRQLNEEYIQNWIVSLRNENLSPKTVKDIFILLKAIARYAHKKGYVPYPDWNVRIPQEERIKRIQTLSLKDTRRLTNYLKANLNTRNIAILITVSTGIRIGECCALRWKDIDIQNRTVTINKTLGMIKGAPNITSPKTPSSERTLPLPGEIVSMIRPIKKYSPENNYIVDNSTRPTSTKVLRNHFNKIIRETDIMPIRFHGLRHTFATRAITSKCDYKTVSELLGHTNVNTTINLYVHPDEIEKRNGIEKTWKMLG